MTTKAIYHVRWDRAVKPAAIISSILILLSFISFFVNGLNWGLDFTGGSKIDVHYEQAVDLNKVRHQLHEAKLEGAIVQLFGSAQDVSIRLPPQKDIEGEKVVDKVMQTLQADGSKVIKKYGGYVGPSVGADLISDGFMAMLVASLGILMYVGVRYQWRFAGGAVLALIHDVVITMGFFSFMKYEFDLVVMAAILTVIGYSLNDTVVVFDRMKENFIELRNVTPWEAADNAINSMLARTIVMSFTVVIVLVALLIWGGPVLQNFSIALLFGVVFGTYSSVYIATALAIKLGVTREDLIPKVIEKEGADQPRNPMMM